MSKTKAEVIQELQYVTAVLSVLEDDIQEDTVDLEELPIDQLIDSINSAIVFIKKKIPND